MRAALPRLLLLVSHSVGLARALRRLEPAAGTLHCAGQAGQDDPNRDPECNRECELEWDAFRSYSAFMAPAAKPAMAMTYVGWTSFNQSGSGARWAQSMRARLVGADGAHEIVPQVGLALPSGASLAQIAAPEGKQANAEFAAALRALGRPALVRIGYEFNGGWNNYPPQLYKAAWRAIVADWPTSAARVWDFSCDAAQGSLNYTEWYPGDALVDWWGVNIFGAPRNPAGSMPNSPCVTSFVDAAEASGFPVLLGESTPRSRGVLDSPAFQLKSGAGLCLRVQHDAVDPGSPLVMAQCAPDPEATPTGSGGWYVTPPPSTSAEGSSFSGSTLQNIDGLCVTDASPFSPQSAVCSGGDSQAWSLTAAGGLRSGLHAQCLVPGSAQGSAVSVAACNGTASQAWALEEVPNSSGADTWRLWFEPYLELMARPTVKAACYIE